MSLKAFHIAFITLSSLVSFFCAAWGLWHYAAGEGMSSLAFGLFFLLGGIALIVYGIRFLRKLKGISFL